MKRFRRLRPLALLLMALAPAAARAQASAEVLDEDQAEALSPPPVGPTPTPPSPLTPSPYNPLGGVYTRPQTTYVRPPVDTSGVPVNVDETGRSPDRPLSEADRRYDARLRASSASAQGMLGPLEGGWRLNVDGVGDVYALQLVDRGSGVEGAWRDLRGGGPGASGFIDPTLRDGAAITLRFFTPGGVAAATLSPQADGRWTGEYVDAGGAKGATLTRRD